MVFGAAWRVGTLRSSQVALHFQVSRLNEIDLEDIAAVRAVSEFEARGPDACIATDERAIMHRQAMRIG
jgi:hypothetical protein